jgi:uncharacterized membrane protein required for colicin V production
MSSNKKTKLFWCGLFVTVLGAFSLFGTASSAIAGYQNYQNYLNAYSHGIPATVNVAVYLDAIIVRAIVFGIIYTVLTGVGVYVAKMGIKAPEQQTVTANQTESALV